MIMLLQVIVGMLRHDGFPGQVSLELRVGLVGRKKAA
jgi:hypothetical protein